jgi:hypothetical protein
MTMAIVGTRMTMITDMDMRTMVTATMRTGRRRFTLLGQRRARR